MDRPEASLPRERSERRARQQIAGMESIPPRPTKPKAETALWPNFGYQRTACNRTRSHVATRSMLYRCRGGANFQVDWMLDMFCQKMARSAVYSFREHVTQYDILSRDTFSFQVDCCLVCVNNA